MIVAKKTATPFLCQLDLDLYLFQPYCDDGIARQLLYTNKIAQLSLVLSYSDLRFFNTHAFDIGSLFFRSKINRYIITQLPCVYTHNWYSWHVVFIRDVSMSCLLFRCRPIASRVRSRVHTHEHTPRNTARDLTANRILKNTVYWHTIKWTKPETSWRGLINWHGNM